MSAFRQFKHAVIVLALVLAGTSQLRASASRNVPDDSATLIANLNNLKVYAPDSPACDGSSASGPTLFTNSYYYDGVRGRGYFVQGQYWAYVSGVNPTGDSVVGIRYFQGGDIIQGGPAYNDYIDTNNACNLPGDRGDGFGDTVHGQDRFDLVYQTDKIWNHGLYGFVTGVTVNDSWDDAGTVEFFSQDGQKTTRATAEIGTTIIAKVSNPFAFPTNTLIYQITGSTIDKTLGCTIVTSNGLGIITITNIPGPLTIRAYCTDEPDCWIEGDLQIGCSTCGSTCTSDGAGPSVQSVRVDINAGATQFGKSAGYFRIDQPYPSTALATPADLQYYTGGLTSNDVVVVRSNSIVQQVFAPQISANVISNSPYQYQILFYTNSTLTGTPDTTWTVFNPDGASSSNRLTVNKSTGGLTTAFEYTWNPLLNGWSMTSEGGAKMEARYDTTNGVIRIESHLIYDGSNNLKFQETNIYQTFPWGERMVQHTLGGGSNALTTSWTFYTNSADANNYGYLYQVVSPGNHWERYTYQSPGRLVRKVTQYLDAPIPTTTAQENTNRVMVCGYYNDTDGFPSVGTTNLLNNQQISWKRLHFVGNETIESTIQSPDPTYASGFWLNTFTWTSITPPFVGEPTEVMNPDGTMAFYSYSVSADGNFRTNIATSGQPDATESFIIDGTKTVSVINKAGVAIAQQTFDIASGLLTSSTTVLALDTQSRPTQVQYLDGTTEATVYGCCGIDFFTDREGVTTSYNYDPYTKQVTDTTRLGITTHNDYDAAGNLVQTKRIGTDSTQIIQNISTYDTAGRLISSTPASNGSGLNQTTAYSEFFDGSNHRINTTTYPDGGTRVETHYQDGAMLSVAGTAVFPLQYSYSMSTTTAKYGEVTKEIKVGGQTNEWTLTYQDALGRNFLTVYSAASGTPSSQSVFNTLGQLAEQIDPDGVATLYQYNGKGEVAYTATDMNGNDSIDFATDRISGTLNDVTTDHGVAVSRSRSFVWNVDGSATSNLVSLAETSADGLQSWNAVFNNGVGVTNSSLTTLDPAHGYRIVTSTAPDGSSTTATYQSGRLISTTSRDASGAQIGQMVYGYDAHGRQNTTTDARNGTTTSYYNDADQVVATLTPSPDGVQSGQVTTNYFDGVGRTVRTTLADNTSVTNVYYTNGLLQKTFGSRTYPVAYTYDYAGRMATMTTWTNFATSGGAAVTTWKYDGFRGFLTNKLYADNNGPAYAYTGGGRLMSRTWERTFSLKHGSAPLQAFYGYNPAGDLSSVTYTDSLPSLSYVYDRLGRQTVITNGANVCTLAYDDVGNLISESYSGGPLNGLSVTNGYDALLRRTAVALASQPATLTQYGYDSASRLQSVVNGQDSATYSYVPNSPLVGQITFKSNSVVRMTTTKVYDNLNRLTQISSVGAASPITFNYSYNTANQRSSVTNADNSYWVYQYDNLGQVTSGKKYWADGTPVSGQQFTYNFDDIGNRKSTASGGDITGANLRSATYTNNALNQILGRTVPGFMTVIGSASSNATATVNLQRASRHADYFSDELVVSNTSAAIFQSFTNVAVLNNTTNQDIIKTNIGSGLVTKTPEIFVYDADGNLTSDGRFTYAWDDENRLTNITSQTGIPNAAKVKLDMVYDYMGRRIQKIVSTNNGSYVAAYTNKYLYDGWNLIAELGPNNALIRSYVWGSDLSGSMQGAGGVGGLLEVTYYGMAITNAFVGSDGNGNVACLVNAADGGTAARYEYGPFGETIRASGSMAKLTPIRFSTKYQDNESDLLYYGYRYYNVGIGKWTSRDLSQELGGLNLYEFVGNNTLIYFDYMGFWKIDRQGGARATAISESGDTITSLAKELKLNADEWQHWLTIVKRTIKAKTSTTDIDVNVKLCPGDEFTIPNTVYVDLGAYRWADRVPALTDTIVKKFRKDVTAKGEAYRDKDKMKLILTDNPTGDQIKAHLKDSSIYIYLYGGHGDDNGVINGVTGAEAGKYTQYGISLLALYACDSATWTGNKYNTTYNTWEWNVSPDGIFLGYLISPTRLTEGQFVTTNGKVVDPSVTGKSPH